MTGDIGTGTAQSAQLDPALVIGCGLIGTSVALGLRAQGITVHLADQDPENARLAESVGAGTASPIDDPAVVVVAVPPAVVAATVNDALARYDRAVVTDVASVKQPIDAAVSDARFCGGHPMAGKERSGPLAASGHLFEGRAWVVVPGPLTSDHAQATVGELAKSLGAVTRTMDAAEHDRAVALVSHVPHLMSVLTAGLLQDAPADYLELAGQGLRDVTRIAGSEAGLWVDIIDKNSQAVRELLLDARQRLDELIDSVAGSDGGVESILDGGRAGTRRIPGKHGGTRLATAASVFVPIDDTPGELSRLVNDTGDAGINIEDLRIDHELGRPVGLVEILVVESSAEKLESALRGLGWAAYR